MAALSFDLSDSHGEQTAATDGKPGRHQLLIAGGVWLFVSISAGLAFSNAAPTGLVVIDWLGGLVWFSTGVVVWQRRPRTYFGPLMMLISLFWFNDHFRAAGSGWTAVYASFTLGIIAALIAYLVFTYPAGRLARGFERVFVIVLISYLLVMPAVRTITQPKSWGYIACDLCERPVQVFNPVSLFKGPDIALFLESVSQWVHPLLILAAGVVLLLKVRRSQGAVRRSLAPVALATTLLGIQYGLTSSGEPFGALQLNQEDLELPIKLALQAIYFAAMSLIPIAFMIGLIQTRSLRGPIGQLVDDLRRLPRSGTLEQAISRALGDPTVRILYRADEIGTYIDAAGRTVDIEDAAKDKAVTPLTHNNESLGVLVHDPGLLGEAELVESIAATAGLAMANERLRAQVRAQLVEVEASRARIVTAADAERRRIERNLHDGAQQRLVALRLSMSIAASQLEQQDGDMAEVLRGQAQELDGAIAELRELAQGIHPAILTDEGLSAAVEILIQRTRLAVTLEDCLAERPPPETEAAAYYVIAEGLTNVQKHARASRVTVALTAESEYLSVVVADDGVGGAQIGAGSGLIGLVDRVSAVGGQVEIETGQAGGTTLKALLPMRPA